jgi:trans-2,3-dihydro-3-hydroxyanthranilate isomerase
LPKYHFQTVDVFTDRRFGGNPLAVFPDARGISPEEMQALAAEFNLSETAFVLPPDDPTNTARVRIFHRTAEMPFAGHPSIGTAYVLAREGISRGNAMRFEVPAGIVHLQLETDVDGAVRGARLTAPQSLTIGTAINAETVAACLGLRITDIVSTAHAPLQASVGTSYILAELLDDALTRCVPDLSAFRAAVAAAPELAGRFSIHVYSRAGDHLRARMFAPLAGTWEDPATGSANTALGALLLSLTDDPEIQLTVTQGVEMGRPSLLHVGASRKAAGIIATVAGTCVPVFSGEAMLDQ